MCVNMFFLNSNLDNNSERGQPKAVGAQSDHQRAAIMTLFY